MMSGILLFIVGVLLAGIGVAGWVYADSEAVFWFGSYFELEEIRVISAASVGIMVIGGGIALAGIILAVTPRKDSKK